MLEELFVTTLDERRRQVSNANRSQVQKRVMIML